MLAGPPPPATADAGPALAGPAAAEPAAALPDGASAERAAASCWEVKQVEPAAPDGTYWLLTPTMVAPEQFYCDMTTDGGGWVLVGRGRDGWTESGDGQGRPDEVRSNVWSAAGFRPRQLADRLVDALLDGRAPSTLSDGVRVVRAADRTGRSSTDTRYVLGRMTRWSWAFAAGHPAGVTMYAASTDRATAGRAYRTATTATTRDVDLGTGTWRAWTHGSAVNNWVRGFNNDAETTGTAASDTFLYSTATWGRYATPMAQVWLRPRLLQSDLSFPQVPDAGLPASRMLPVAESGALPGSWGVTGTANGRSDEFSTEAHAFAQIGSVMYVGGNFARVEEHADRRPGGAASQVVDQPYLAAFDAATGVWLPGFRPVLDNQVHSLAALPDGRLAVAGEFTTVDGRPASGLAVIDPSTGQLSGAWQVRLENRITGERLTVQSLDAANGWLYLGGNFTHLTGPSGGAVYARKAARIDVATGMPDATWNPAFDGKVFDIDASSDGARVYASGYFSRSGATPVQRVAVLSSAPGAAVLPFAPSFSVSNPPYQQAVHEAGTSFWVGGSQHSMFGYDTTTRALFSQNVTLTGGDFQAIADQADEVVYGACHCDDWVFGGQRSYPFTVGSTNPTWTTADRIGIVGAWDARTGTYLPEFAPTSRTRGGFGAWALTTADDGTLWAGGSYVSVVTRGGTNQWAGGFVRFAARPHVAPQPPSDLGASLEGTTTHLTWSPSPTPGARYELLLGGRVVAVTTQTSIDLPGSSGDRWFVRATDGAGNRSATTPMATPVVVTPSTSLVAKGATWSFTTLAPGDEAWALPAYDDAAWSRGPAPLGWGSSIIRTTVAAAAPRPVTTYYRHSFDVADPGALTSLTLSALVDDGVLVRINGVEVGRSNLPPGAVTATTYATAAPTTQQALTAPLVLAPAPGLLRAGTNVVTVEVHANYRSTPTSSLDLELVAR